MNNDYVIRDDHWLFEGQKCLCQYIGKEKIVIIPDSVEAIAKDSFLSNKSIEEVVIPVSVKAIEGSAFHYLNSLKQVTIKNGKCRCNDPFANCNNLEKIIASDEVLDKILNYANTKLRNRVCFRYLKDEENRPLLNTFCKKQKKTLLPIVISNDDAVAFSNYVNRVSGILTIDEIDEYLAASQEKTQIQAFLLDYKNEHYSAKEQENNKVVNEEKELGFRERSLEEWRKIFGINKTKEGIVLGQYKGNEETVIIPENIQGKPVIELKNTFYNNKTIREVTLPETIKKVDGFSYCEKLETVNIPESVEEITIRCFEGCCSLASIQVPEHVMVGVRAFKGCNSLADSKGFVVVNHVLYDYIGSEEDICIPDEVEEISVMAFSDNNRIRKINIGDNVRNIGYYAFAACGSLIEIRMNGNVSFDESVFEGCSCLTIYGPKASKSIKRAKRYGMRCVEE